MKTYFGYIATLLLFVFIINTELPAQQVIQGIHYATGKPVEIKVKNGNISEIKNSKKLPGEDTIFLAPGLFDNQVNGFAGVSFSFGNSDLTMEGIEKATQELWKFGITSYMPTLTTNSKEVLVNNFKILSEAVGNTKLLGSIPGFHLEGPYINPEDGYRGAHPKQYVRLPDWNEFLEMYKASGGKILQVTLAPEMEGAMDFIGKCRDLGIIVAVGHHNATKNIVDEAVRKGAKISTHLGNGCANMINRHVNPLWPQLANDSLMVSLICDGFHLLPEEIKVFYDVKGRERTIITSDVTSYASLPPGEYKTQTGESIELTKEGKLFYPAQNVLYGSASPITYGVGNMMKVTGCSLADAVKMASTNPAALYGLTDRGRLATGLRADIILFIVKNNTISIQKTFVNGSLVYSSEE